MGIIQKVKGTRLSPPTLPPRCDGTKPVQWLAMVCEYFQFYEVPLVDRLNRVASMLDGSALAWFNWRMRGGLIDGWEDFIEKFKIRFASLHDLDYVCFENTSEKSRDTFAHIVENANTLPAPTVEDTNEQQESSEESFIKEDNDSGSDVIDNDGGAFDEDYGAQQPKVNILNDSSFSKSNFTPHVLYVQLNALVGVDIFEYEILRSADKAADEDYAQADNLVSFDTIKLFDIDDVVKSAYQVSEEVVQDKKVTGTRLSPPTLPPRCDGTKPVQWLAMVCEYFQFYEVPLVDRLNRVASMLDGSVLAWFNWRMRGGLIDGWEDFIEKFKIRFAPLHDLDYVCFENTSEKSRDTFAHMVENANTLPAPTVEDTNEQQESSEESFIKEDNDSGSDVIDNDGGAFDEDYGAQQPKVNILNDSSFSKSNFTPHVLYVQLNALVGVDFFEYEILRSADKAADEDYAQADNLVSFDTIKLFDIDDVVKSAYQVSEEVVQDKVRLLLSLQCYTSTGMLHAKCSGDGLRLGVNIWSYVQKHEWDPPP
ncbi:unnamed protein product [Cuscuta campestris]|uniref:Retrotransposon gag domain-containing protein n=1 Tax=Cuscuta campestris TaxID=132261 RepID=A0A484NAN3_9ASTE|nr:unnamed protein product [Cuscuta campestris]